MRPPAGAVTAFAPGRVNLVGEHTDHGGGLALPFAVQLGVTVTAAPRPGRRIEALAEDLGERDAFEVDDIAAESGWRALLRGTVAELATLGCAVQGTTLSIHGTLPIARGVSSSAAFEVALALALLQLHGMPIPEPLPLARLCSRAEQRWSGARTGLLDQLASISGEQDRALRIDFASLTWRAVPCTLQGWHCVLVDSGEPRALASSGYNRRRAECDEARTVLGVRTLRQATRDQAALLPQPLQRRVLHIISENERVDTATQALEMQDIAGLAALLNQSHASLRDDFEVSTPAVEVTRRAVLRQGALGARIMGGGFGGSVLALFPPDATPPDAALSVAPSAGARLLVG